MQLAARRRIAALLILLLFAATAPTSPAPLIALDLVPCLGAPPGEPAGGMYPEPRIFFESQSWWTEGEPFPGRHIHTGACIPWMQPVDGVVQYHVRNLLHESPGTETFFRLTIWNNGPEPSYSTPMGRSCATRDCIYWDSFTINYTPLKPGRWEHRFTHNIADNFFQDRQFTTTRWHICIRTCVGGASEAYTRAVGAAGWYEGLDYANAFLDPDDYIRLRDGVTQGEHMIRVKYDQGFGSLTVDPDAHGGNPGIIQCRMADRMPIGGFAPVPTGTTWFQAVVDTRGLAPGVHKLALRGSNSDARGVQEGVLVVPFRVLPSAPTQPPTASFTASPTTGDAPLSVAVTDTSGNGPTAWTWNYGDGSPAVTGQAPPAHTYATAGTYTLTLTATNAFGSTTASQLITVNPPAAPVASFNASPTSGVAPLDVAVIDTSTGNPTEWSWNFGDGSPVITGQAPPVHTYGAAGTYTITLTARNATGPSTASRVITVNAPPPPVASFTASPSIGPAPLAVTVTDTSLGNPVLWQWDFGDGTITSGQAPAPHTYIAPGVYTITLTASNAVDSSVATRTVIVANPPPPVAGFTVSPESGSAPLPVTVTDTSTGNPTGWLWDFGDNTPIASGRVPGPHTYASAGTYTITLTAINGTDQSQATRSVLVAAPPRPTASFNASPTQGVAPLVVTVTDTSTHAPTTWSWDFGDGTTSTQQNPLPHTYATPGPYVITLVASNAQGSDTTTRAITVTSPPAPIASFGVSATQGLVPLDVTVTDTSTQGPTAWSWDFGDGTIVTGQNPGVHRYTAAGTYTITLTVSNAQGPSTATATISVTTPPPPTAAFTASPTSGIWPLVVTVADQSTNGPTSWLWDFGDGTTSNAQDPGPHTYAARGVYTLTLTVSNAQGPASATRQITVNDPPPPTAAFGVSPAGGQLPIAVTVTDASTGGPTSWLWEFGDGSTSTAQNPAAHTYTVAGDYTIRLTASNAWGPSTATRTITVTNPPPPTASFTANPVSGNVPLVVSVTDTSTNGPTSWSWNYGDQTPLVTGRTPGPHTYTTPGSYTLTLTASNAWGPGSTSRTITVLAIPPPVAAFTATPTSGNAPLAVSVADASTGGPTSWSWNYGDGTATVSGQHPAAHTYAAAGTFTITLTAGNVNGSTTATRTIVVSNPPPPPPPTGTRIKDITFDPTLTDPLHGADRTSGTVTRETAAPLAGPGSARISNAAAFVEETFAATNDLFVTFRVRLTATPTAAARLLMISNGGTTQGNLLLQTTGRLRLRVGSTNIGAESIAMNTSTTYVVGIHQRRGTGGNAVLEAWIAPVGTPFGAPFASLTNGTWATAADRVRVGGTNGTNVNVLLDNLLLDSGSLPTSPLP